MIEEQRLAFLRYRKEQELETAYRSISTARKIWHLAIAGEYSTRILEIEKIIAAGQVGAG
ncbi:hypothetical protein [Sphingomonas sp. BAUL-RG-20F-R05-02]|uniref:hypothetical protein n=1 Tax=Sphingomonas sp. BAUL-RG-20F-R05-02 TaxID=2914830 RepID=UPI001F583BB5|nr:hypothetical protein [Sphingomonas sp. BAUL-RG-20F-R05-02]